MQTRASRWTRVSDVVLIMAMTVLNVDLVVDLWQGTTRVYSAWDWVVAVLLLVGLVASVTSLVRRAHTMTSEGDLAGVDLSEVREVHERDGYLAAVRELRRQHPTLSLRQATSAVDDLGSARTGEPPRDLRTEAAASDRGLGAQDIA